MRPSPERLDAQLKAAISAQETLFKVTSERNAELTAIFGDVSDTEGHEMVFFLLSSSSNYLKVFHLCLDA